jgi:putative toxin-antitoxin system antitoxin component (TIGR02293 family)
MRNWHTLMQRTARKPKPLDLIVEREIAKAPDAAGTGVEILDELAAHGFDQDELFELVVPRRTLARRRDSGSRRLSLEESDRAVRLARIAALSERVFGDEAIAHAWLREPSRTLAGATPLSLLKTETGAQLVEQTLHRIDFGMLA